MPARIRLKLSGSIPENPYAHARALQAFVYERIALINSDLAQQLHDGYKGIKPIAISPLAVLQRGTGQSTKNTRNGAQNTLDTTVYVDVSILDDSLIATLYEGIMRGSKILRLKSEKRLVTYVINPKITILHYSWQELSAQARPAVSWHIHLLSPTACRKQGRINPLPQPEAYFASWYHKWQCFSPQEVRLSVGESLLDFVKTRMDIAQQQGKTMPHTIRQIGEEWPAFMGMVEYRTHKATHKDTTCLRELDALTLLANFCGTGAQTMCGMGQTRAARLEVLERKQQEVVTREHTQ